MTLRARWTYTILLCLCCVVGCGSIPPANYPLVAPSDEQSGLGPGDRIEIVVFNGAKEEMRSTHSLDEAGTISIQYIGDVNATGLSVSQLRESIQAKLAADYLRAPIVSISLLEVNSRRVSVSGEVQKDGTIKFVPGMTIVDVIAVSGGFSPNAKRNEVRVTRTTNNKEETYTIPVEAIQGGARPNFPIAPGDRIFVPERVF